MLRSPRSVALELALAFATLLACESREAGEGCWNDWECASNSCSFGTCDSGLLGLLEFAAEVVGASSRRPSDTPYTPPLASSVCSGLAADACSSTPDCQLLEYCLAPIGCTWGADAGVACFDCMYTPGCPAPCRMNAYCH